MPLRFARLLRGHFYWMLMRKTFFCAQCQLHRNIESLVVVRKGTNRCASCVGLSRGRAKHGPKLKSYPMMTMEDYLPVEEMVDKSILESYAESRSE